MQNTQIEWQYLERIIQICVQHVNHSWNFKALESELCQQIQNEDQNRQGSQLIDRQPKVHPAQICYTDSGTPQQRDIKGQAGRLPLVWQAR